jgi:hypothetical protein
VKTLGLAPLDVSGWDAEIIQELQVITRTFDRWQTDQLKRDTSPT